MAPHLPSSLVLVSTLFLGACGGGGSDELASAPAPAPAPAPTPAPAPSPAPAPGAEPWEAYPGEFASLQSCITHQRWVLVADQAEKALTANPAPGVSTSMSGQGTVEIGIDGTYVYRPNFTIHMQTPAGPASGQLTGSSRGTWALSGTTLVTQETSNNITGSATGSFGTVPLPPLAGFSSMESHINKCNGAYFDYEVLAPTGNFTQRLVLSF